MANITIFEGAMIGVGIVITKDIPAFTLWYGNPVIHQGYVTEKEVVLDLNLVDKITTNQYILQVSGMPKPKVF